MRAPIYWIGVALLAVLLAAWGYYDSLQPVLRCPTGHCPDPGSREYLSIVQRNIDGAPKFAAMIFMLVMTAGALLWIGYTLVQLGLQRIGKGKL